MTYLRLSLLGSFQATVAARPPVAFRSARTQALLAYLAVEAERPQRRELLAGLLWPDQPERAAAHNLSQTLLYLRQAIPDPPGGPALLLVSRQSIQLNPASDHWVDVATLLAQLRAAQEHSHPTLDQCPACLAALQHTVDLYAGSFLAGFSPLDSDLFEEWALLKREWLQRQVIEALEQLTAAAEAQRDYRRAQRYAWRVVELDPLRETARRSLMRALALDGQHALALAQYDACYRMLADELGTTPSEETTALYRQIREQALAPAEHLPPASAALQLSAAPASAAGMLDTPDPGSFYGRADESATLQRWLALESCRLVTLLGMGGVGKTTLAAYACEQAAPHFEHLLWRSLLNAPPPSEILRDWLQTLASPPLAELPASLDAQIELLLDLLRSQRCLLVLDNLESVLQPGDRAGSYRQGYGDYGQLMQRIGQSRHRSCLLLTSRERPSELVRLESRDGPVRALRVRGVAPEAGRAILREQDVQGSDALCDALIAHYSGNPLALRLTGQTIRELFGGDAAAFLQGGTPVFDTIRDVLDQQFERLTALERDLLIWLAIEREPVTLAALGANLAPALPMRALMEAAGSLQRRSLLEPHGERFTLQNVVIEYLTDRLVMQASQEISDGTPDWISRYALIKAQAKEYLRQSQERLIMQPVAEALIARAGRHAAATALQRLLARLHAEKPARHSYAAGTVLNLLLFLGEDLHGYDFSQLSVWQANLRAARLRGLNFAGADLAGSAFTETFHTATSIAFSHDGQTLAAATASGVLRLWSFADGQPTMLYAGHLLKAWSVTFSPDGRWLASGSEDQTVRLWDTASGATLAILNGHHGWVRAVAFSPDGRLLASASDDQTLRLWDVASGDCCALLEGHSDRVRAVAFSPDGRLLASASADQTLRLWDVASGDCRALLAGHSDRVRAVAFSPDGRLLASASYDRTLRLWEVASGEQIARLEGHSGWVVALAFSPDGRLLASAGADQTVRLWDMATQAAQRVLQGHRHAIEALAFHPSGLALASASIDQTVRVWEVASGQTLRLLQGYGQRVRAVACSPAGTTLASTSIGEVVWLWDVASLQPLTTLHGDIGLVEGLAFSPDSALLASAGEQAVRLSDARSGATVRLLRGHSSSIYAVAFSPDGAQLASASSDQTVRVWSPASGALTQILRGHSDWVKALAFSPDGRLLASAGDDRTVRLWDLSGERPCLVLHGHANSVSSVAFHPAGALLASASSDQTLCLWDVADGARREVFAAHRNSITTLAFSPDGTLLASAGLDQTVCLWDVAQRCLLRTLTGHSGAIRSLAFHPDSARLITASDDKSVRLWDVTTGRCEAILRAPGPYEGMNISGATGLSELQRGALRELGAVEETAKVLALGLPNA